MEWFFRLMASEAMLLLFTLGGLGILMIALGWWFRKTADTSLDAKNAEWDIVLKSRRRRQSSQKTNQERKQ